MGSRIDDGHADLLSLRRDVRIVCLAALASLSTDSLPVVVVEQPVFSVSTLNNVLLMVDKVIFPVEIDLSIPRYLVALTALGFLFRGLIFEEEESR